ncbi:minor capsid protein [Lacticaseibacillus paracasei]|nr:minor capsid protein [Lacticaseibacillus paracasei]UVH22815.1 minor capsid protein [Lacticaseibacillus paracasei]
MPLIDDSWLQGQAEFDSRKYTITTVNVLKDADTPEIWGYELEVL